MNRPVRKLFDLEIDEVSVVDRPANQHGLIAFAKSAGAGTGSDLQEVEMPDFYDADGDPVDPEALEHGDLVYDDDGNEYVFSEEDEDVEVDGAGEEVGKAGLFGAAKEGFRLGGLGGRNTAGARAAVGGASRVNRAGAGAGVAAGRNKRKIAIGAGVAGTAGVGGAAYGATRKSLGDDVLEQLSKAATEHDREAIIVKALNEVTIIKSENEELRKALEVEQDLRITEAYISKAAEYNLPVSPAVLGPILKAVAAVLSDEQLDVLDALFTSVSDTLYDEIGYVGDTDNASVLDTVNAYAGELVGKSDFTTAQAMTALFEANPAAYDAYLLENGR